MLHSETLNFIRHPRAHEGSLEEDPDFPFPAQQLAAF